MIMRSLKKFALAVFLFVLTLGLGGCSLPGKEETKPIAGQVEQSKDYWTKNGNLYTTVAKYSSPEGEEETVFEIELENGFVKKIETGVITKIDASIVYQNQFAKDLPKLIVGKKLSEITDLDIVSGASLTTAAFNKAIGELKLQLGV